MNGGTLVKQSRLKERVYDHEYELKNRLEKSVFLEHFFDFGHRPSFNDPNLLASYTNPLMADLNESYFIQTNNNLLNRNIGSIDLSDYIK